MPTELWFLRHGESAGNVARERAEGAGLAVIEIEQRDMDVPLSERGRAQAHALGAWLRDAEAAPDAVLASPYARSRETVELVLADAGLDLPVRYDERLREREFGVLDRLTLAGIRDRFPEQDELRGLLGKFYHRPPGGESWCDVGLRVRSVLEELRRDGPGDRVLVVTHEVVVKMARYVIEGLDEAGILAIDRAEVLANCSLTRFRDDGSGLALRAYNDVEPLAGADAPVTHTKDAAIGRG